MEISDRINEVQIRIKELEAQTEELKKKRIEGENYEGEKQ